MLPQSLHALEEAGYLRGESMADVRKLSRDVGILYEDHAVDGPEWDEVQGNAQTYAETLLATVGQVRHPDARQELIDLVARLTRPDGPVQDYLNLSATPSENGGEEEEGEAKRRLVLCTARVTRDIVSTNGEPVETIKVTGRFASDNPEQVEKFHVDGALDRVASASRTAQRRVTRAVTVVPELEQRRQAWIERTYERVQAELPMPTQNGDEGA